MTVPRNKQSHVTEVAGQFRHNTNTMNGKVNEVTIYSLKNQITSTVMDRPGWILTANICGNNGLSDPPTKSSK